MQKWTSRFDSRGAVFQQHRRVDKSGQRWTAYKRKRVIAIKAPADS